MAFSRSGLCSLTSEVFAWLSVLARFLVPGLYEVIQYTLSLSLLSLVLGVLGVVAGL